MIAPRIRCSHCEYPMPAPAAGAWAKLRCMSCQEPQQALVFPAVNGLRIARPRDLEAAEGRALCFFHAEKAAKAACDLCGRYLCSLCDLAFESGHFCAACLDAARSGDSDAPGKAVSLLKERVFLPQNLALFLAFYFPLTIIGFYFIPFTALAALYVSIRYWKSKEGVQRKGKWPFAISILLALTQLGLAAAFIGAIVVAARSIPAATRPVPTGTATETPADSPAEAPEETPAEDADD